MSHTKTPIHSTMRRLTETAVVEDGVHSKADAARVEFHQKRPAVYVLTYSMLRAEGIFISDSTVHKACGAADQAPTPEEINKDMSKDEHRKVWRFDPAEIAKRIGGCGLWQTDIDGAARNLPGQLKGDFTEVSFQVNGEDVRLPALTPEAAQVVRASMTNDFLKAEAYLMHHAGPELAALESSQEQPAEQHILAA